MKKTFPVLTVFASLLLFASCATYITFNEELSEEETAVIHFRSTLSINEYNGIAVRWTGAGYIVIKIPGGRTHFST
jgi:hypothetical protein